MKNKYYYLHIWAVEDLDSSTTIWLDRSTHPPKVGQVGLEIDFWPADDLFAIWPVFFVTERLRAIIQKDDLSGLSFEKTVSVKPGYNFIDLYPNAELPPYYWRLVATGTPGIDDFALWKEMYMVVSEKALTLLRDNHVTHAEADEIEEEVSDYFNSDKKDFWMKTIVFKRDGS